jgi:hypothetical protein
MPSNNDLADITRATIVAFCKEFLSEPYLCYTEHGLHALFFTRLYMALPEALRYRRWNTNKVCTIQKEYCCVP